MKIPFLGTGCSNHKKQLGTGVLLLLGVWCQAESLSVDRAIDLALRQNPDVAMFKWQADAAAAGSDVARSTRLPEVKLRSSYSYYSENQRLYPATYTGEAGVFGQGLFSSEVVLSVPLYTGGRISSEVVASDLLQWAAQGDLARTQDVVAFNVTSLFYSMLAQHEVVRSVESGLTAMTEQRRTIQNLVDAQKAARVDVLRAEVRVAELKDQRTQELNTLTILRSSLAAVLGIDDGRVLTVAGELELPMMPDCSDGDGCVAMAIKHREDYTAARQRVQARSEKMNASKSKYRPSLSLEAGYGLRAVNDVDDNTSDDDESGDQSHVGLIAEWPLFSGGGNTAKVREQAALYYAEQQRERKLRLRIRSEVETALAGVTFAAERVETMTASVTQARESFRIIKEKYELGKGAMVDVLNAQAALVSAETALARAKADLVIQDAQRKLAVGVMVK